MINEDEIKNNYFNLQKIIYIEKDEQGNILKTNNKEILSYYDEIIGSEIVENNQYYHIGHKKWYKITKSKIHDDTRAVFHTIEYIEDITELKKKYLQLKLDSLTGLMRNREECNKLIDDYINKAIDKKEEFSILIGDIDYFKNINDTYGHYCGDFVLRTVSKILLDFINYSDDGYTFIYHDIILRFGGDEFLILLKNISEKNTITKINDITRKIKNQKLNYNNQSIPVSMSFGYAHFNSKNYLGQSASKIRDELSKKADEQLYVVKKSRNY